MIPYYIFFIKCQSAQCGLVPIAYEIWQVAGIGNACLHQIGLQLFETGFLSAIANVCCSAPEVDDGWFCNQSSICLFGHQFHVQLPSSIFDSLLLASPNFGCIATVLSECVPPTMKMWQTCMIMLYLSV